MLHRTFRSLRHRNYRLYFLGQLVSFTGSWMQSAALMWLAYDLTSDPFWPPLMLVAAVGPTLFLGTFGGALADRYPKKTLIFITQSLFLVSAISLAGVVGLGVATPLLLVILQGLNGVVQAVDLPARLSFVPDLIPKADLINAVGLNSLTFNLARALGPAIAGIGFGLSSILVEQDLLHGNAVQIGACGCFLFNAISFIAVLWALARIDAGQLPRHQRPERSGLFDGIRFLMQKPGLMALVLLTGILSIFAWPVLTLLPAYTSDVLHLRERAYSYLVSALGAGALVGSLVTATLGTPGRRERFLFAGSFCGLLGILGLTVTASLPLAFLNCWLFGFGLILYLSTGQSTMQLDSPDSGRGKVMALWAMTLSGASIPGHLLAGHAARLFPLHQVLAAMLVGVAITVLGILLLAASGQLRPRA